MLILLLQIIEASAIAKVSNEGLPMEVYLSKNLRHRNIVKMLDYATRVRKVMLKLLLTMPIPADTCQCNLADDEICKWPNLCLPKR